MTSNPDDRTAWEVGKGAKIASAKSDKLSEIGHGQVPFMGSEAAAAAVSFARVTQRATVSFAQLRRVGLGGGSGEADAAVRAVLVALGLHAHQLAFGRGFVLRSGAELRRLSTTVTWLGAHQATRRSISAGSRQHTRSSSRQGNMRPPESVPLDGWDAHRRRRLTPKANLQRGNPVDLARTRLMLAISVEFLHGTFRGDPDGTAVTGRN